MAPFGPLETRVRSRRPLHKPIEVFEDSENDEISEAFVDEPPQKRLRTSRTTDLRAQWVPGGTGGGGRRVDMDDSDVIGTNSRNSDDYLPPRRRGAPPINKAMTATPRYSARSRTRGGARPRYSTAAAASAAVAHGDGYKPREERGWEEFHPDLELHLDFAVIESSEVDGVQKNKDLTNEVDQALSENEMDDTGTPNSRTPGRKRVGRPPRNRDSMLNSLIIPEAPKIIPVPGPNPRERLTLPKPSFRELDPFLSYEHKDIASMNFVDKTMANVGYQESEIYLRPDRTLIRQTEGSPEEDLDLSPDLVGAGENSAIGGNGVGRVEYDMDEQDVKWLDAFNKFRTKDGIGIIKPAVFEITMTKIEKEWHALEKRIPKPNPKAPQTQRPRSSSAAAVNGEPGPGEETDSKCAICDDGDCENANAIVFCDGCDLAVHQECYGVPYIPEGQWLCRKCQLVGNARPSCIFCPMEGGAFKQTNNSKWAHLFCATWIPEVSIGNPSLMEPITDVEKVPPSRWKLGCYICNQNMGASIQCSDGRCYEPFHLTCARQAGLYLRMKTGGGQNTLMDPYQLRAYCHKHTPLDWRQEHQTDKAFERAKEYFKEHFRGQVWADSRTSALAMKDTQELQNAARGPLKVILTNKKGQKPKTIWRLPSGAPVIPEVILKSIEESLVRFGVQKKKEYVSEICKYWTLKREARRGAALLKRLQLQMDTFSSFEVTRRDYKAQGAAGRARLEKRIQFAETLLEDLDRIRQLCALTRQREAEKLKDAGVLKDIIDTVYFPISPLLEPVLEKAIRHDSRGIYRSGLMTMRAKLAQRFYTAVSSFSADLAQVFSANVGVTTTSIAHLQSQIGERTADVSVEERDARTLARRLLKAVQPGIIDAFLKEAELTGRPYAQEMKEMEEMLSRRGSLANSSDLLVTDIAFEGKVPALEKHELTTSANLQGRHLAVKPVKGVKQMVSLSEGSNNADLNHVLMMTAANDHERIEQSQLNSHLKDDSSTCIEGRITTHTPPASTNGVKQDTETLANNKVTPSEPQEPPTPPLSLEDQHQAAMIQGGIPWYVEQFDPEGTTIHEERWTGPEVLREMSVELSEMDEEELEGLGRNDLQEAESNQVAEMESVLASSERKGGKKAAKQRRGNDWGQRSFRHRRR